jgi:hypothetical protein
MRRVALFLALCLIVLSHGSRGEAAPHVHALTAAAAVTASAGDSPIATHDAHEHEHERERSDDGGQSEPVAHVHVSADVVQPMIAPVRVIAVAHAPMVARNTAFMPSRDVAPLLEPPSA